MPYHYSDSKKRLINCLNDIYEGIYTPVAQLSAKVWITAEPVNFEKRKSGNLLEIKTGETWGKLWDCGWFHLTGTIPKKFKGEEIALIIDLGGEGCVVDEHGDPLLGLSTESLFFSSKLSRSEKRIVPFTPDANGGESVDLWVEVGNNGLFGEYDSDQGMIRPRASTSQSRIGILNQIDIAVVYPEIRKLYHDFRILHNLMEQVPNDEARYHRILSSLCHAMQELSPTINEMEAKAAKKHLAPELAKTGGTPSLKISAIGHAHIDLAWLWPIRETIRKGARTFATALYNMELYPDYVFGASQAQLYQWIKDHYPQLFERIKTRVAEGRWEIQGALWVEPDTNVPNGESLIRQILYGKHFFKREFGVEPRCCWLPDVFGYSGALPQILKGSGIKYFLTQKLSWNLFNTFPHHTFVWEGIDGSQVLAHMPPENTYNSAASPESIRNSERKFADKVVSDNCLLVFGIGNGGGGPGEDHLEALKREKNLAGLPPVNQEPSETFFDRIATDTDNYKVWKGELYMERHQGTYTTQGRNKQFNRCMEIALRELEMWSTFVDDKYPATELEKIWKEVLLYQFHDILPGSSIKRVYDESLKRYKLLESKLSGLNSKTDAVFAQKIDSSEFSNPVVVKNSLSWERNEWLCIDGNWLKVTVPSIGYATFNLNEKQNIPAVSVAQDKIENDILQVSFEADGRISSIFDKENNREVLAAPGNLLSVFTDHGDAWDIEYDYRNKPPEYFELVDVSVINDGPRGVLFQNYKFGNSTLEQKVVLTAGSRRLDFETKIDWKEDHKMVRTMFPVNVFSQEVFCDIQFGQIKRTTHENTSWDMAQHEICAHKWVDLSQPDYGVALLNNCKYGHYVKDNILELNLLRSPDYPDPTADRAKHEFTYALLPHSGNYVDGYVARSAYELNMPLIFVKPISKSGELPPICSFLSVDAENIVIETVKRAENNNDIIVRLYESQGANTKSKLKIWCAPKTVFLTDLVENNKYQLNFNGDFLELDFNPFQIITLRITI